MRDWLGKMLPPPSPPTDFIVAAGENYGAYMTV